MGRDLYSECLVITMSILIFHQAILIMPYLTSLRTQTKKIQVIAMKCDQYRLPQKKIVIISKETVCLMRTTQKHTWIPSTEKAIHLLFQNLLWLVMRTPIQTATLTFD